MRLNITIFFLLIVGIPIYSKAQKPNRVSLQSGLFHLFFDKTPIINTESTDYYRISPLNAFGGYLNDSWGINYERLIKRSSYISVEFMNFQTRYFNDNSSDAFLVKTDPFIIMKNTKIINATYTRKIKFKHKFTFEYGAGINYIWGEEQIYLENICKTYGCSPYILNYKRSDMGINVRTGIEYDILEWLTVFTNIDFLGTVYLAAKNGAGGFHTGEKTAPYLNENYNLKNIPSRFDLSWRFGIGINFGK